LAKSHSAWQVTCAMELEGANASLRAELETASSKLAEVERHERTLTSKNEGLKIDLVDARSAREVVVRETKQSKLQHFQVSVRKRLVELLRDTETFVSALGG
jgi:hypothetical protein